FIFFTYIFINIPKLIKTLFTDANSFPHSSPGEVRVGVVYPFTPFFFRLVTSRRGSEGLNFQTKLRVDKFYMVVRPILYIYSPLLLR
ncbi:unnamed protein product, partial [Porites evermanni]